MVSLMQSSSTISSLEKQRFDLGLRLAKQFRILQPVLTNFHPPAAAFVITLLFETLSDQVRNIFTKFSGGEFPISFVVLSVLCFSILVPFLVIVSLFLTLFALFIVFVIGFFKEMPALECVCFNTLKLAEVCSLQDANTHVTVSCFSASEM